VEENFFSLGTSGCCTSMHGEAFLSLFSLFVSSINDLGSRTLPGSLACSNSKILFFLWFVEEKLFSLGTSGHCTCTSVHAEVLLSLFSLFVSSTKDLGSRTLLGSVAGSILEFLSFLWLVEEKLFSLGTSGHCASVHAEDFLLLFSLFISSTDDLGSRTLLGSVAGSILEHLSFLWFVEEKRFSLDTSGHCTCTSVHKDFLLLLFSLFVSSINDLESRTLLGTVAGSILEYLSILWFIEEKLFSLGTSGHCTSVDKDVLLFLFSLFVSSIDDLESRTLLGSVAGSMLERLSFLWFVEEKLFSLGTSEHCTSVNEDVLLFLFSLFVSSTDDLGSRTLLVSSIDDLDSRTLLGSVAGSILEHLSFLWFVEEKLFSLGTSEHCTSVHEDVLLLSFSLFVSSTDDLESRTLLGSVAGSILEHLSFLWFVEEKLFSLDTSEHCTSAHEELLLLLFSLFVSSTDDLGSWTLPGSVAGSILEHLSFLWFVEENIFSLGTSEHCTSAHEELLLLLFSLFVSPTDDLGSWTLLGSVAGSILEHLSFLWFVQEKLFSLGTSGHCTSVDKDVLLLLSSLFVSSANGLGSWILLGSVAGSILEHLSFL